MALTIALLPRERKAPVPGAIESNRTVAGICHTDRDAAAKAGRKYRADLEAVTAEPLGTRTCHIQGGCVCGAAISESTPAATRPEDLRTRRLQGLWSREEAQLTF